MHVARQRGLGRIDANFIDFHDRFLLLILRALREDLAIIGARFGAFIAPDPMAYVWPVMAV